MSRENVYKGVSIVSLVTSSFSGLVLLADSLYKTSDDSHHRLTEFVVGGFLVATSVLYGCIMRNKNIRDYSSGSDANDSLKSVQEIGYHEH